MALYTVEHKQMKEIIKNFDGTMVTKANKVEFFELRNSLSEKMSME